MLRIRIGPISNFQNNEYFRLEICFLQCSPITSWNLYHSYPSLDMDGIVSPGERVHWYHKTINKVLTTLKPGEGELPVDKPVPIRAPPITKSQPIHIDRVLITQEKCRVFFDIRHHKF